MANPYDMEEKVRRPIFPSLMGQLPAAVAKEAVINPLLESKKRSDEAIHSLWNAPIEKSFYFDKDSPSAQMMMDTALGSPGMALGVKNYSKSALGDWLMGAKPWHMTPREYVKHAEKLGPNLNEVLQTAAGLRNLELVAPPRPPRNFLDMEELVRGMSKREGFPTPSYAEEVVTDKETKALMDFLGIKRLGSYRPATNEIVTYPEEIASRGVHYRLPKAYTSGVVGHELEHARDKYLNPNFRPTSELTGETLVTDSLIQQGLLSDPHRREDFLRRVFMGELPRGGTPITTEQFNPFTGGAYLRTTKPEVPRAEPGFLTMLRKNQTFSASHPFVQDAIKGQGLFSNFLTKEMKEYYEWARKNNPEAAMRMKSLGHFKRFGNYETDFVQHSLAKEALENGMDINPSLYAKFPDLMLVGKKKP